MFKLSHNYGTSFTKSLLDRMNRKTILEPHQILRRRFWELGMKVDSSDFYFRDGMNNYTVYGGTFETELLLLGLECPGIVYGDIVISRGIGYFWVNGRLEATKDYNNLGLNMYRCSKKLSLYKSKVMELLCTH